MLCADETRNNPPWPADEWPKTVWPTTEAQMAAISDEWGLGCTTYEKKTNIYAVVDPVAEDGSVKCVYGSTQSCPFNAWGNRRRLCPCLAPPPPPSAPPPLACDALVGRSLVVACELESDAALDQATCHVTCRTKRSGMEHLPSVTYRQRPARKRAWPRFERPIRVLTQPMHFD